MFGSKQEKAERLKRMIALLETYGALSPAQIADRLGVPRSTVLRDLPKLEDQGFYLHEDENGHVSCSRWW